MKEFRSLAEMLLWRVRETPDKVAFQSPAADRWVDMTWRQVGEDVKKVSGGLRALGLNPQDRCAILCSTRVEWMIADMGIMNAAGATTTIYPSNTPDECAFIINDSNAVVVFAENDAQVQKLQKKRAEMPAVRHVVVIEGSASDDGWVLTFAQLKDKGASLAADQYEALVNQIQPDWLATLIYTSGTTGKPKGVELTHDVWVFQANAMDSIGVVRSDDTQYLWLPLAHVFGKVLQALVIKAGITTAVDGRVDKIVDNLSIVRPSVVAAVPRIFEKVYAKVHQGAKDGGGAKWAVFSWAKNVGIKVSRVKQDGKTPGPLLALQHKIAHALVFKKIHERFGGRMRVFVSGSAPLQKDVGTFFHGAGFDILEGYGLTETSGASTVNRLENIKYGTCGAPLPGVEVKLAADGEVLIKGRNVMRGYHGLPAETAEALDSEGFLHTGDVGQFDEKGRLMITDRKKELIKTSGGKYVAPQAIESRFKVLCPYASQMVVHGDTRNYCTALIAIDEEGIKPWAAQHGITGSYAELTKSAQIKAMFQAALDQLNSELPSYSTIKKFTILPADLSEAAGDLTPSQKLKRKAVQIKYKALLDAMYE